MLAVTSALLLSAAWPASPFPFLIFIAFVPILMLEGHYSQPGYKRAGWKFFGWLMLIFLTWNILTTWWIWNASPEGATAAIIANSLLMTLPLLFFRITRRTAGSRFGYTSLFFYWISFEHLHYNWELNWPWLAVGNVFARFPEWVQWYEYTGVPGGTVWVWLINLTIYHALKARNFAARQWAISGGLLLIVPLLLSYIIYFTWQEKGEDIEVVIIQPNIDPYAEKYEDSPNYIPVEEQIQRFVKQAEPQITANTRFVVFPETAIGGRALQENIIQSEKVLAPLKKLADRHPQLSIIIGASTYLVYNESEGGYTERSRYREDIGHYDHYNTALHLKKDTAIALYHKSKLVPAVEGLPYPHLLNAAGNFFIDLGGTTGGLGIQKDRTVFTAPDGTAAGPVICYESIFGDFVTEYVRKGADVLFIITNDGWWGHTAGHRQHLHYASLRAIETRRSIARSANTGISCYINQRGDILQPTKYWEQATLRSNIKTNKAITFYVRFGDYIGRILSFIMPFLLLSVLVKRKTDTMFKPRPRRKTTAKAKS